jgi:hypothetical protein
MSRPPTAPLGDTVDVQFKLPVNGGAAIQLAPVRRSIRFGPLTAPPDFWLLDLASMRTRRLTQLSDRSAMRTFDITPDGQSIVFDRTRENSDIVLIDLAP